jgi:hypothetical protein
LLSPDSDHNDRTTTARPTIAFRDRCVRLDMTASADISGSKPPSSALSNCDIGDGEPGYQHRR